MKITKSQLKQLIKEELEAVLREGPEIVSYPDEEGVRMRRMSPKDRGKRMALSTGMHQGDMTPEEEWRWKTGLKIKNTGYNHGLNAQPWGGRMGPMYDPGQFTREYAEGYEDGLEDSRKGESLLTPYEQGLESDYLDVSLGGQEVSSTSAGIGTRMGPYKSKYRAMPPEEKMRQATSKYAGIDPSTTGDDAMNDPRNPAYAYPKKRRK